MTATPARIGFVLQQFRLAVSETPSVSTRHGNLARESDDPVPTFFDDVADAQVIADQRQALLSPERRRFQLGVDDAQVMLDLDYQGSVPQVQYRDTERQCDRSVLISSFTADLSSDQCVASVWG